MCRTHLCFDGDIPTGCFSVWAPPKLFSHLLCNMYIHFFKVSAISYNLWPVLHGPQLFWGNQNRFLSKSKRLCSEGEEVHYYPCTSSSVKPVFASTSKTCQAEANLRRIPHLNARTLVSVTQTHQRKSVTFASDTRSSRVNPAPPWLEKIRESWKMAEWKRKHLLTFAHIKRCYTCFDEATAMDDVRQINKTEDKSFMVVII